VEFKGHGPVVPHNVVLVRAADNRGLFPVAGKFEVRLGQRLVVDESAAVVERHGFAGQTDDAFHEHDTEAGQAHGNDVAALRFMAEIGQAVDEVALAVMTRRQHGDAFNTNGQKDEIERDKTGDDQHRDANQRHLGPPANE
jgi:hypothetical protein